MRQRRLNRPDPSAPIEPGLVDLASDSLIGLLEAAETTELDPVRRRWWALPLRLAVSAAMLLVLWSQFPDFSWSEAVPSWSVGNTVWFVGAAMIVVASVALSAVRWLQVLDALGRRTRLGRLVSMCYAGQFVSNILPTTIGGDVLRVSRLSRENGDTESSFASVVLERLTGWLVLPIITMFGLAINPGLRNLGRASVLAALVAVITLTALIALVLIADHPKLGGRFATREGWTRFIGAIHLGLIQLRSRPRATATVFGAGIAYQIALCVAALMVATALGLGWLGITAMLAFYPAVSILQVLPVGIAGLGVRESALVLFLTPLGVPAERAVTLGLMMYALSLIAGLFGAPSFAMGGRGRSAAS